MKKKELNSVPSNGTKLVRNIIITVIVLIIVLLGVIAYLYFFTDIFKTNKDLFIKYSAQLFQQENGFIEKNLDTYFQRKEQTPYENKGSFYVNIDGGSNGTEEIIDAVNNFSIDFSGKTDKINNKAEQNITLQYSDDVNWPMIYRHTGDFYGIQTDDVSEKYVTIENNNLKELLEKMGSETTEIPDKIDVQEEIQAVEYTPEEMETVINKYLGVLDTQLKEEQFQEQVSEDGTTTYILTMQNEEFKNLVIALLTELQNDNITLEKIKLLMQNKISGENVQEINAEFISKIISSLQESKVEEGEFSINLSERNDKLQSLTINNETYNIKIDKQVADDTLDYNIEMTISNDDEIQGTIYFNSNFSGITTMQNVNEKYQFGIKGLLSSDSSESFGYEYNFENAINFVDMVEIEELTEDNSIILNDYDTENLQNFVQALNQRIIDINTDQMTQLGFEYGNPMIFMLPLPMLSGVVINNQAQEAVENTSMQLLEEQVALLAYDAMNSYYEKRYIDGNEDVTYMAELEAIIEEFKNSEGYGTEGNANIEIISTDTEPSVQITSSDGKYKVTATIDTVNGGLNEWSEIEEIN